MQINATRLPEVLVLEPAVFADARGVLWESFNAEAWRAAAGIQAQFVLDVHSHSTRGVLRGLHYQLPPHAQGKLVSVVAGRVFDVAVDMRRSSPRLGQWVSVELSAENRRQSWIPPGFAHGFLVLSDSADTWYKMTAPYAPQSEVALRWDDPALGIECPEIGLPPRLSARDARAAGFDAVPKFDSACRKGRGPVGFRA
jgi:dTDP-4-dehydrorhamnose 3,5-epimerase